MICPIQLTLVGCSANLLEPGLLLPTKVSQVDVKLGLQRWQIDAVNWHMLYSSSINHSFMTKIYIYKNF